MSGYPIDETPKVFISYSWDSEDHKAWVLAFAKRLRDDGIDAILDQIHLQLGGRTPEFMERSIRDTDTVLVICTEDYKLRFDDRKGGAGYEGHIITADMLGSGRVNGFIPVLRQGDWQIAIPTALGSIKGVDLRSDSVDEYRQLVHRLYGPAKVPPVGSRPHWLEAEAPAIAVPSIEPNAGEQEYWDQCKRAPETDLLRRIWQMPRIRIWSRPTEFRPARFRNMDDCADFVRSSWVQSDSSQPTYPAPPHTPERSNESISQEIERTGRHVSRLERWVLFQSGQFVQNMALPISDCTHVLEILDTATALFEFVGRMADRRIFTDQVRIAFYLSGVQGRQLTRPSGTSTDRVPDTWCQHKSIHFDAPYDANTLRNDRRKIALNLAIQIYSKFGWNDPSEAELEKAQQDRFGEPRHS